MFDYSSFFEDRAYRIDRGTSDVVPKIKQNLWDGPKPHL